MPATSKTGRLRSKFICQVESGTILATVFAYLNGNLAKTFSQREGKQRATDALLAFWKPYALRAQKAESQVVQEAARTSIGALERQIQLIRDDFGIQSPVTQPAIDVETLMTILISRIQQFTGLGRMIGATASAPTSTSSTSFESVPSAEASDEVIFADDEDLLGDLA
ncbi:hypothetical protein AB3R30_15110 [Leptolyngbyaceae cyanobacterium UHCC 1019]